MRKPTDDLRKRDNRHRALVYVTRLTSLLTAYIIFPLYLATPRLDIFNTMILSLQRVSLSPHLHNKLILSLLGTPYLYLEYTVPHLKINSFYHC